MSESKEITHARFLFHIPVCWDVPSYMIDNEQYASIIGRRTTGSRKVDRIIENQLVPCVAFLSEFATVFRDGHRMGPSSVDTGIKCFYHLTGHLIDWATHVSSRSMIEKKIPIEGLREFSELAAGVHKVAKLQGYDNKLIVRRSLWSTLKGRKAKNPKAIGGYNTAMMDTIEEAYRRRKNMGMLGESWGEEYEKRRI